MHDWSLQPSMIQETTSLSDSAEVPRVPRHPRSFNHDVAFDAVYHANKQHYASREIRTLGKILGRFDELYRRQSLGRFQCREESNLDWHHSKQKTNEK